MTNNIYPPDHLLRKWEQLIIEEEENVDVVLHEAFQAGADEELKACCLWVAQESRAACRQLKAHRRPTPLSLKQQALLLCNDYIDPEGIIRRAIESLPD